MCSAWEDGFEALTKPVYAGVSILVAVRGLGTWILSRQVCVAGASPLKLARIGDMARILAEATIPRPHSNR